MLDKMSKYEMDSTRTVGATERTRDAGRTDGWSETNIPPTTSLCIVYNEPGSHQAPVPLTVNFYPISNSIESIEFEIG